MKKIGVNPISVLTEISPTSLLQGHGEKVCIFLNLLADCAIATGYTWKSFNYLGASSVSGTKKKRGIFFFLNIVFIVYKTKSNTTYMCLIYFFIFR